MGPSVRGLRIHHVEMRRAWRCCVSGVGALCLSRKVVALWRFMRKSNCLDLNGLIHHRSGLCSWAVFEPRTAFSRTRCGAEAAFEQPVSGTHNSARRGATGEARVRQTGKEDLDNHVSHLLVLQRLQSVSVITLRQKGGGRSVGQRGACVGGGSFSRQASSQISTYSNSSRPAAAAI